MYLYNPFGTVVVRLYNPFGTVVVRQRGVSLLCHACCSVFVSFEELHVQQSLTTRVSKLLF